MEPAIDLGQCACGNDATWFREEAAGPRTPPRAASSIGSITLDDVTENLCDGCFRFHTGSLDEAVPGWKRVDVLKRQQRAGEENQDRDSFGDDQSASAPDDW